MASEFITRTGEGEYQVISKTDDKEHYHTVQDLCRQLIDHLKPDEPIRVVRCKDCRNWDRSTLKHENDIWSGAYVTAECKMFCDMDSWGEFTDEMRRTTSDWYCADGRREFNE